jgi:hypothetical protein
VTGMRLGGAAAVLAALLVAAVLLIGIEAANSGAVDMPAIAKPCTPRTEAGVDPIQALVNAGLDRAACRLGTTREELLLSLSGSSPLGGPRYTRRQITTAIRQGLLGAVDEAGRQGTIPPFAVPVLEQLIRHAPIQQLLNGGLKLSNLLP